MPLKKAVFILFIFFFAFNLSAQQTIYGKVKDSTNVGIEYATVAVLNTTDSLVLKSTLTNEKGEYEFVNIPNGNYVIKTFLVGYLENYTSVSLFENVPDKEIPTIFLRTKGINLNEVNIVTLKKSIEFKNGNITVNIEDSPLAQGNSAFTLLSRLPGVTIDENNNILMPEQNRWTDY